jgi:NADPH:quinone reductase-like Zn-dependent oxidoreductase
MKATVMYGAGDVRIENVPDAGLIEPTDALVRVTRACICGSDLWPYTQMTEDDASRVMGHEAIGVVDAVGAEVRTLEPGYLVVMPFDEVPEGYRLMNEREVLKFQITPWEKPDDDEDDTTHLDAEQRRRDAGPRARRLPEPA